MQTQRVAKRSSVKYLQPPLRLETELLQEQDKKIVIHVRVYSGNRCFAHRSLVTYLDALEEIPVLVSSSLLSWTIWLVEFEAQRRLESQHKLPRQRCQMPQWPSPTEQEDHWEALGS